MVQAAESGEGKLVAKDFIFIAIFGLLLFIVFLVFAMIMGMNATTFWYTHALGAIPGGIVWMYLLARVPKRGAILCMSVLTALVALLMGMLWTGPVGIVIGGVLAELIAGAHERTTTRNIIAFVVWVLCFWAGQVSMIFLAGDAYVQMVVATGMSADYAQGLIDFAHGPLALTAILGVIVGATLGGLLGAQLFKKHFAKIAA